MEGKGQSSSIQEGGSHTYTLRLDYSRNSILYKYIYIYILKHYLYFTNKYYFTKFKIKNKKKAAYTKRVCNRNFLLNTLCICIDYNVV